MFIDNEQKPTLRSALIILSFRIRATENIVIRTDPHSSLKSLVQDRHLSEENITLELGSPKNLNKNAVAVKAIQELRREILSLCPGGGKISDLTLAKALQSLNTRIRHTGRSSRELWLRRDQVSGDAFASMTVFGLSSAGRTFKGREVKFDHPLILSFIAASLSL